MATTRYALTSSAWTDLGAAPSFIQAINGDVFFVIESTIPTTLRTDCHALTPGGDTTADIGLTGNVYARAGGAAGVPAVVIVSR